MHRTWPVALVVLVALVLRLAFVAWAPRQVTGDAIFYNGHAMNLIRGNGFVEPDGSPQIQWQPGWPIVLAALTRLFGEAPHVGMIANAIFGALAAGFLVVLGSHLFTPRIGLIAGWLYALWPGNIVYAATLFSEPLAGWLVVACLTFLAIGAAQGTRHAFVWFVLSGCTLGCAAMVKAEPLFLLATVFLFLWITRRSMRSLCTGAVAVCVTAGLVVAPWTYRNYLTFGRFSPTSGSGGMNVWLGNHANATGGEDFLHLQKFHEVYQRPTFAETMSVENEAGWRDAGQFVRAHPVDWLRLLARKLWLTYSQDHQGVTLVRGVGLEHDRFLTEQTEAYLDTLADAYWFVVLGLAVVGLLTVGSWKPEARVLVCGLLLTWTFIQLLTIGGDRFHFVQEPAYALMAACAVDWVWRYVMPRIAMRQNGRAKTQRRKEEAGINHRGTEDTEFSVRAVLVLGVLAS